MLLTVAPETAAKGEKGGGGKMRVRTRTFRETARLFSVYVDSS